MQLISPTTVDAALGLLDQHVDQARIIAGGTDLVLDLKNRKSTPDMLISIHRIESLRGIERQNGSLVIGPNVSPAELMESPLVGEHAPLLRVAALEFGAPAVREMATIGGNIVTASPAA